MPCVYPECDATPAVSGAVGHCPACLEPVFICPKCGGPNRSLARLCRSCGEAVHYPAFLPETVVGSAATVLSRPAVRISIPDTVWLPPVQHNGHLWVLAASGQLYRLSPYNPRPVPVLALGDVFGRCAFVIRECRTDADGGPAYPYLITASPHEVKAVSLLAGTSRVLSQSGPGETFLANSLERYCGVDADSEKVFYLSNHDGAERLMTASLITGETLPHPLQDTPVVGPFRCGDQVFAYTGASLLSPGPSGVRLLPFPRGFQAWTRPEARDLKPTIGRLPFMVCGRAVYIPGEFGGRPHFLFQRVRGGAGESAFVPVPYEATFRQDQAGRPVLSVPGKILVLDDAAMREIRTDSQIMARQPAFSNGGLSLGFVQTAGGEKLRCFTPGGSHDIPLGHLPGFFECLEYFGIGNALMLAYLTESERMEVAVWYGR